MTVPVAVIAPSVEFYTNCAMTVPVAVIAFQ